MAPDHAYRMPDGILRGLATLAEEPAWMNQAAWRHCHFGLKSAPQHRDFRPGKVGVN